MLCAWACHTAGALEITASVKLCKSQPMENSRLKRGFLRLAGRNLLLPKEFTNNSGGVQGPQWGTECIHGVLILTVWGQSIQTSSMPAWWWCQANGEERAAAISFPQKNMGKNGQNQPFWSSVGSPKAWDGPENSLDNMNCLSESSKHSGIYPARFSSLFTALESPFMHQQPGSHQRG